MKENYRVVRNSEIPVLEWNKLLEDCDQPSYFQSPKGFHELKKFNAWNVEALGLIYNNELSAVVVYVVQQENGIKAFFSKRCIIFSGPIFKDKSLLGLLMTKLENVVSDVVYLEIRNGYPSESFKSIYASLGWKYLPWLNFIVDTKDRGVMIKRISESRRRQLRKAEKLGVTILNPDRESDVKEFYAILLGLYKTKIKKPLPEYELFRNFFLMDTRNYVLVYFEQKVIGGILCPFLEGVGNYEFYIAGLDQAYKDCYPSAMATFGAMKQANEMNLPTFDFMGGGSPSEGYGVREFKSRFGGEEVEWGRWLKVRKKLIYYLGSSYIKWKAK